MSNNTTAGMASAYMLTKTTSAGNLVLSNTGGLSIIGVMPVLEEEQADISAALLEDKNFVESIKRAREEMRRGEYLTHQEVFGD